MSELKIKVSNTTKKEAPFQPYQVNGYWVEKPLTTNGGGFCKWGFCRKFQREFFLKEFLSPKFPKEDADISERQRTQRVRECNEWFQAKQKIYQRIIRSSDGNLVLPSDFFRFGNQFYLVTERIDAEIISMEEVSQATPEQQHMLLKVLAHAFASLAKEGIVHADVKPANLLFKRTVQGWFTAKVIDFDASFWEEEQLEPEEIMGDGAYYAPETILRMLEEDAVITPKADVFALGLLFHQIINGSMPTVEGNEEYGSMGEAVLNGETLVLGERYQDLIAGMLRCDPEERLSSAQVLEKLREMDPPDPGCPEPPNVPYRKAVKPEPKPEPPKPKPETHSSAASGRWKVPTDFD